MTTVGLRLRFFAKTCYDSISGLARTMNVAPQAFDKYLKEERLPGGETLLQLYELGCDATWLLTGKGIMYADSERGKTFALAKEGTLRGGENYQAALQMEVELRSRNLQKKLALCRSWLTISKTHEEWYQKLRSYDDTIQFDDVLVWEGILLRNDAHPPQSVFVFLMQQGININWLSGDNVSPFTDSEEGIALARQTMKYDARLA